MGDVIEVALTLINLDGLMSSCMWEQPVISHTPRPSLWHINDVPSIDITSDLNRVCELEDFVTEWYDMTDAKVELSIVDLRCLLLFLTIQEEEYSALEHAIYKFVLRATEPTPFPLKPFGGKVRISIHPRDSVLRDVAHEIKPIGYLTYRPY